MLLADIDSQVSLQFLERFTTQACAEWLSVKRLTHWLHSVGYSGRTKPAALHEWLTGAPRGATGHHADTQAGATRAHLALLRVLTAEIAPLAATQIGDQLDAHPDRHTDYQPAPTRHRTRRPAAGSDR